MVVVHRVFRRELVLVPQLVRKVAAGDTNRARIVGGHLQLVLAGLEMHHTGEDALLWPLLLERAAPSTGLVETMQAQHRRVDEYADHVAPVLEEWMSRASEVRGEQLAQLLDRFAEALFEHLDLEEREILPLARRHLSIAEWDSLGDHGKESMTARQLPLMFGCVVEDTDVEERAQVLGHLPAPVRVLLRTVGAWHYRRYITRVRAG